MGDVTEDTHNIHGNIREQGISEFARSLYEDSADASLLMKVRIHKVAMNLKEHNDYEFYFVPRVVSLGPFHHNAKPEFEAVEKLKPHFTNRLLLGNEEIRKILNGKLFEMVKELRGYYDADVTCRFSDEEFTTMMQHDGCFLLYFIKEFENLDDLDFDTNLAEIVKNDVFLMENQIPYQVLIEVMKLVPDYEWDVKIKRFVDSNILVTDRCKITNSLSDDENSDPIQDDTIYLLQFLQRRLSLEKCWCKEVRHFFRFCRASELTEKGIRFRPNTSGSLACYNFVKTWCFLSYFELPPITVQETTKGVLLNTGVRGSPITMYLCILDFLIVQYMDVRILRKAGVLTNLLGHDRRVFDMLKEIGRDVRFRSTILKESCVIHKHSNSKANTWDATYIKSLWISVAVFGWFLMFVRSYLGVWWDY